MTPGSRVQFWSYEADYGWETYGVGAVTPDGRWVVPSQGLRELKPAAFYGAEGMPSDAPTNDNGPAGQPAEPVDLASGLYFQDTTDLFLDDVVPLDLKRTYRTNDLTVHSFGVGTKMPYELYLASTHEVDDVNLVLPDGARIHFVPIPPNAIDPQPAYEARETPGPFFGARLYYAGAGFLVVTLDGTRYVFGHPELQEIADRNGNITTVAHVTPGASKSPAALVMSPNGHWIELAHDDPRTPDLITSATDDMGRTVRYEYDPQHRLVAVADLEGGVTRYTYDDLGNMTSVVTPGGKRFVENEYDEAGRIVRQTQADGGVHLFSYVSDGVGITSADYTDPRGAVRRVTFDENGRIRTATYAVGTPEEQTHSWERQPGTKLLAATVDGLGRRTEYTYDDAGRPLTETRLAGTSDAVTISVSRDPTSGLPTSIADALGHTMTIDRDLRGNATAVTDATDRTWTLRPGASGQPVAIADPAGNEVTIDYRLGLPQAATDPVGNAWQWTYDAAGRLTSTTDPLGARTAYGYDGLDRLDLPDGRPRRHDHLGVRPGRQPHGRHGRTGQHHDLHLRRRAVAGIEDRSAGPDGDVRPRSHGSAPLVHRRGRAGVAIHV